MTVPVRSTVITDTDRVAGGKRDLEKFRETTNTVEEILVGARGGCSHGDITTGTVGVQLLSHLKVISVIKLRHRMFTFTISRSPLKRVYICYKNYIVIRNVCACQ